MPNDRIDSLTLPNSSGTAITYDIDLPVDNSISKYRIWYPTAITGTAPVTSGTTNCCKWDFTNTEITTLYDGLHVAFHVPVVGESTLGVALKINDGSYHPVVYNINTTVGSRYGAGSSIDLIYNANQSANITLNGTSSSIQGVWQVTEGSISYADLGLENPMTFVGISTSDPKGSSGATVQGHTTWSKGDIVLYKRTGETYYEEYINITGNNTAASWELLGDDSSYALKTVQVTGTGALSGGGDLTQDRTITHQELNTSGAKTTAKIWKQKLDNYGHVTEATEIQTSDISGFVRYDINNQGLSTTEKSNARTNIDAGTVSSVDGSGEDGISVTGGPIISTGTLTVGIDDTHKLPTITEWNNQDIDTWQTDYADTTHNFSGYRSAFTNKKVYAGIYAVANGSAPNNNTYANQSVYFLTIHPISWDAQWSIRYRLNIHLDDETQRFRPSASGSWEYPGQYCKGTYDCSIQGTGGTYNTFHFFQSQKNTSYRPIYYHMIHETTSAGFNAGEGHKIGVCLYSSYRPTPVTDYSSGSAVANTKYTRTVEVILDECVNCTVTLNDNLEVEADAYRTDYTKLNSTYFTTNASSSNSSGRWINLSATTQGLYESGDDNTYTYTQQSSNYLVNGSKNGETGLRLFGYNLIGFSKEGKALGLSVYSSTQTSNTAGISVKDTRIYNTEGFDYTKGIRYYSGSSVFLGGADMNVSTSINYSGVDLRYSDNCVASASANTLGLVNRNPVYLRGTIGSDGLFYLAPIDVTYSSKTYQRVWVQDGFEAGYVYWFIGYPYYSSSYAASLYQINLMSNGGLVEYKNGALVPYVGVSVSYPNEYGKISDGTTTTTASTVQDTINFAANGGLSVAVSGDTVTYTMPDLSNTYQPKFTDGSATIASEASDIVTLKAGVIQTNGAISNSSGSDITLAKVAKTGNYSDLNGTPSIPTSFDLVDNILDGSANKYAPYAVGDKAAGRLYSGTTNPTNNTRLNYDGYFYATKLYSNGSETLTSHLNEYGKISDGTTTTTANTTQDTITFAKTGDLSVSVSGDTVTYGYTAPTSLKNPNKLNIKVNSETSNFIEYDGSAEKTVTIKPSSTNGAFIVSDNSTNKTIQLAGVFTDTWIANSSSAAGYVASGSGQNTKVWKTNASGEPAWRDDSDSNVAQTVQTASGYTNWRTIPWGDSNSATEGFTPTTATAGLNTSSNITFQPSTGTLRTLIYKGQKIQFADSSMANKAYWQYNSTDNSIDLIFN